MQMSTGGKYPVGIGGDGCATKQAEIPAALGRLRVAVESAGRAADGLRDKLKLVTDPRPSPGHPECPKEPEVPKSPMAVELNTIADMVRQLARILEDQTERTQLS